MKTKYPMKTKYVLAFLAWHLAAATRRQRGLRTRIPPQLTRILAFLAGHLAAATRRQRGLRTRIPPQRAQRYGECGACFVTVCWASGLAGLPSAGTEKCADVPRVLAGWLIFWCDLLIVLVWFVNWLNRSRMQRADVARVLAGLLIFKCDLFIVVVRFVNWFNRSRMQRADVARVLAGLLIFLVWFVDCFSVIC